MPPLLSWYLIGRNEGSATITPHAPKGNLFRCLRSLREVTPDAEIIFVEGGPSTDDTLEVAKQYADRVETYLGPRGDWTKDMLAFDNAAAARNFALSFCAGKWAGWIDADDTLATGELAKKILEANAQWDGKKTEAAGEPMSIADILTACDENPRVDSLFAPYAYAWEDYDAMEAGKNYICRTWQGGRRRFHRNNGEFHFIRAGHEDCVHKWKGSPPSANVPNLVWMHHSKKDAASMRYSLERHFKILWGRYIEGKADFRDLQYLMNFARSKTDIVTPEHREKIYQLAFDKCGLPADRYVVYSERGTDAALQGFWLDAESYFGAAHALRPDLPDVCYTAARLYEVRHLYRQAEIWYGKGQSAEYNPLESLCSPRAHFIEAPCEWAIVLMRLGDEEMDHGRLNSALSKYRKAFELISKVKDNPAAHATKEDDQTACVLYSLIRNHLWGAEAAGKIRDLWSILMENDEAEKATKLLDVVPWMARDTPVLADLEGVAARIKKHLTDRDAYTSRYDVEVLTEVNPNPELRDSGKYFTPEKDLKEPEQERMQLVIGAVCQLPQKSVVVEIGPYDGAIMLPILAKRPDLNYIAMEAGAAIADKLRANVRKMAPEAKNWEVRVGSVWEDTPIPLCDALICTEVLEHVQKPVEFLAHLGRSVRESNGTVYLSTPLGAVDRGNLDICGKNSRRADIDLKMGFREHVRALTVRDLENIISAAGLRSKEHVAIHAIYGPNQVAFAKVGKTLEKKPVAFVVPAAHWGWNATEIEKSGIGASEESICYLARELAKTRKVEVYGQMPVKWDVFSEVRDYVRYWPIAQVGRIDPKATVVVSRGASYWHPAFEGHRTLLWMQDATQHELAEPEVLKHFDKIVAVSPWHREEDICEKRGLPLDRVVSIPNFLLREHFPLDNWPGREPHRFIYASSPDRGLIPLLELWPEILAEWPDAELHVCYGWDGMMIMAAWSDSAWVQRHKLIRTEWLKHKTQKGVFDHGRLTHAKLAELMRTCSVWAYPYGPGGNRCETDCNTARKMRAAGVVPVTSPLDGLKYSAACELTQWVETSESADWFAAIKRAVVVGEDARREMAKHAVLTEALENRMPAWLELLD